MSTFSVETRRKIKAKSFGFCYNCRQLHPRMEHHHLLANTKLNEKLYGREVIQSVENGVYVCQPCHTKHTLWDKPLVRELKLKYGETSRIR